MRMLWRIAIAPWRWWCGCLLAMGVRATSSAERILAQQVEQLERDLRHRDQERIPALEAQVKVLQFENKLMADVIARDRTRVKAEMATFAEKVAQGG